MFKVGDAVKVKKNADKIKSELVIYVYSMKKYLGGEYRIACIKNRNGKKFYNLDVGIWAFAEEWLEPVNEQEINIKEDDFEEILCLK